MTLTNPRANFGLNAKATPTKSGTTGTVTIGDANESVTLLAAQKAISFDAVIVGSTSDLVIDISDLDSTGSTSWVGGTAQIESATVGITTVTTGTMVVTLTSGVVAGSPLAINVPLVAATHNTAALVAQAIVDVLNATAAVSTYYTATRSTATVVLTRKITSTYTVNGASITVKPADDSTLKLEWSALLGVNALAASTSTTAGVATSGAYCPDLDGTDFEGEATAGASIVCGVFIHNNDTSEATALLTQSTILTDYPLTPSTRFQVATQESLLPADDITIEPSADSDQSCHVTITLAGG